MTLISAMLPLPQTLKVAINTVKKEKEKARADKTGMRKKQEEEKEETTTVAAKLPTHPLLNIHLLFPGSICLYFCLATTTTATKNNSLPTL